MSENTPAALAAEHRRYMQVFVWLGVLTVLEIGATYLPLSKVGIGVLLVGMAATKAALVALYYMHLRFEPNRLRILAIAPLPLAFILVLFVIQEYR